MMISQIFDLIKQYIIKGIIDLPNNPNFQIADLYKVIFILLTVIILELIFFYISNITRTINVVKKQTPYISEKLFNNLNRKSYPFFIDNFSGKISSSINEVNNEIINLNTRITTGFISLLTSMISSLIILYTIDFKIFITAFVLFAGIIITRIIYFSKRYLPLIKCAQETSREYDGILNDAVLNFTSLKVYSAVENFSKTLKTKKEEVNVYKNKASSREFTYGAIANVVYIITFTILLFYSINQFGNNLMTLGNFIFFINAMISLKSSTTSFTWSYIHIGEILVKLKNCYDLLYDHTNLIDDKDISDYNTKSIYENLTYVPQETILLHSTIYENIKIAKPSASYDEIISAAKKAELHQFIESLDDKYNTIVGERGIKLSGGQRQRIALARIFLRDSKIVIFDEATSSLDNNTEFKIQQNINKYFDKQTIICIAHRLSTLKDMDYIMVIDNGNIIDSGKPKDIIPKYDKVNFLSSESEEKYVC